MKIFAVLVNFLMAGAAMAQSRPDIVPEVLGRDIIAPSPVDKGKPAERPVIVRQDIADEIAAEVQGDGIFIGSVRLTGNKMIATEALMPAVEPFLGKSATTEDLRAMARAISERARALGFVFASASIPPQQAELGMVTVRLDEGAVDEIRLAGSRNKRLKKVLANIAGPAVRKEVLERALLIAGDLPGITVQRSHYLRENGRGILVVQIKEERARGIAAADSYGSKSFGPVRARLEFELTGLLDDADVLTTQAVVTPASPKELAFLQSRYAITLNSAGTRLSLAGALGRTRVVVPNSGGVAIKGQSHFASIGLAHPLLRSNRASLWLTSDAAYLNVEQSVFGVVLQRDDIVTFSAGANGDIRVAGGRLSGGVGLTQGLRLLGATEAGDVLASRGDGSSSFTKGTAWANWFGPVGRTVSLRLAAHGQLASRPLLAAQELGLGGPGFGRAYDFSERYGDQGVMGLIEVRRNFQQPASWVDWAHIYAFADGGYVDNINTSLGDGSLFSAGLGLRGGKGPFDVAVEAAFPLSDARNASGKKDPRFNVSAGIVF